jgi:hypothetical protein
MSGFISPIRISLNLLAWDPLYERTPGIGSVIAIRLIPLIDYNSRVNSNISQNIDAYTKGHLHVERMKSYVKPHYHRISRTMAIGYRFLVHDGRVDSYSASHRSHHDLASSDSR